MAEAKTQKATDEAKYISEELRRGQQLVKSIETQLSSSKAELVKQLNEIAHLENERNCLSSSFNEVQVSSVMLYTVAVASRPHIFHNCRLKLTTVNVTHIY